MDWPTITDDLPGIDGILRAKPEHFVVDEISLYEPCGEGQHLYVNLTKVGQTTKEIQRHLARLFSLNERDVGFAGMKDKHARTTQTFSLAIGHQDQAFVEQAQSKIEDNLPVTVNWVALHKNKLRPGHLLGNRFRIVITDLAIPLDEAVKRAEAVTKRLSDSGAPNYFGPQRFGQNGANVDKGLRVLQRKQYVKDRWLRRFLVSAYQSYLCNQYLAKRVERGLFYELVDGDVAKKHDTGGMFDVENLEAEQLRYANQEVSYTAPLFGPKMRAASGTAGALEAEILDESPITLENLRKAKVDGTRRMGRLLVSDLMISPETEGLSDSLVVSFSLPKGAFATTILREIMKVDLTHIPDE